MSDNKPLIISLIVVLAVIVGVTAWFVTSTEPEPPAVTEIAVPAPASESEQEPGPEPVPIAGPPEEPEAEEEPALVLPRLEDSDPLVRDGVVGMTRHEGINPWLASNQLVPKFVALVDSLAHGQIARGSVRQLTPDGPFRVKQIDEETYELDPASYERYNQITEVAVSVDARRAAEFYDLLRPLIRQAYSELGYEEDTFDDVVFQAIGRLLETPVIEEPIRLVRPVVVYRFEDEQLEALSAAQKQMIRMGPRNTRLLQAKIREVSLELRVILGR